MREGLVRGGWGGVGRRGDGGTGLTKPAGKPIVSE